MWRKICYLRAKRTLPDLLEHPPGLVDWQVTKLKEGQRSAWLDTAQANGVNSKDRAVRHHQATGSNLCEHHCEAPDNWHHRLCRCRGTAELRTQYGLDADALLVLQDPQLCQPQVLWWYHPPPCRPLLWNEQDAWGLWPTQSWLQQLIHAVEQRRPSRIQADFYYRDREQGRRPQLRRHAAWCAVRLEGVQLLSARATKDGYHRRSWEQDAVQLLALVATFARSNVFVAGLATPLRELWSDIEAHKAANTYLVDTILLVKNAVFQEQLPVSREDNLSQLVSG